MGDNDFTAGDPWGLPIEESEEYAAGDASDAAPTESDVPDDGGETAGDRPATTDENQEGTPEGYDGDEEPSQPAPEEFPEIDEPAVSDDSGWWRSRDETPPPAIDREPVDETAEEEEVAGEGDEETEADGEEYTFKAPARTPLSQMIAAAQSVVGAVQGSKETAGAEDTDDRPEPEPSEAETDFLGDETEDTPPDHQEEVAVEPAAGFYERIGGEDDMPAEPPAWLITDSGDEERLPEPRQGAAEAWEPGVDSITPADIEASIAELATPAETSFAEDRFDLPETTGAESEFRDVDLDSSPGVYSELHYLADESEQAEALLQEAAVAFGQAGEPVESLEDAVDEITETPPDAEEIDSFAEALATEFQTEDTPLETTDDLLPEPDRQTPPDAEEIDSYAEALATELQTEDTPLETTDDLLPEPDRQTPPDAEEIDSYADALATEFPDTQDLVDSDIPAYISDVELGEALAGLADSAPDQLPEEIDYSTEDGTATAWGELAWPGGAADEDGLEDLAGDESEPEPVGWAEDEPGLAASVASEEEQNGPEAETIDEAEAVIDESLIIDSPVAWGTRYRDAHQGWIEDDEGRSTWRPIVTSGQSVAGWDIDIYLGMVSGDVALDPPALDNLAAVVAEARETAGRRMLDEALARGAHAVVGVTFSIQEVAGAVLVAASGVAVTLRTPA